MFSTCWGGERQRLMEIADVSIVLPMNSRIKLHLVAAGMLVLALAITLSMVNRNRPTLARELPGPSRSSSSRSEFGNSDHPRAPEKPRGMRPEPAAQEKNSRLTAAQIEAYLESRQRNSDSLLAAYGISGDAAYLKEAMGKFPGNPQVLLVSLRIVADPAKQLEILEAFKQADPGNGLGNYLAAKELIKLGRQDEAIAELIQSSGKGINNFSLQSWQNAEEAYLAAGVPAVQAKMNSLGVALSPELTPIFQMTKELGKLAETYENDGDLQTVESLRVARLEIGRNFQNGTTLIDQMVGISIERQVLKGDESADAQLRLAELDQQKATIANTTQRVSVIMQGTQVSDSDWMFYFDRAKLFGEAAAGKWLVEKYPNP